MKALEEKENKEPYTFDFIYCSTGHKYKLIAEEKTRSEEELNLIMVCETSGSHFQLILNKENLLKQDDKFRLLFEQRESIYGVIHLIEESILMNSIDIHEEDELLVLSIRQKIRKTDFHTYKLELKEAHPIGGDNVSSHVAFANENENNKVITTIENGEYTLMHKSSTLKTFPNEDLTRILILNTDGSKITSFYDYETLLFRQFFRDNFTDINKFIQRQKIVASCENLFYRNLVYFDISDLELGDDLTFELFMNLKNDEIVNKILDLNLSGNKLTNASLRILSEHGLIQEITSANFSNNQITSLNNILPKTNLVTLNLCHNPLSIQTNVDPYPNLSNLDLSSCKLEDNELISARIFWRESVLKLKSLNLSNNRLTEGFLTFYFELKDEELKKNRNTEAELVKMEMFDFSNNCVNPVFNSFFNGCKNLSNMSSSVLYHVREQIDLFKENFCLNYKPLGRLKKPIIYSFIKMAGEKTINEFMKIKYKKFYGLIKLLKREKVFTLNRYEENFIEKAELIDKFQLISTIESEIDAISLIYGIIERQLVVIGGMYEGDICVWNIANLKKTMTLKFHKKYINSLVMTRIEGIDYLFSGAADKYLVMWNMKTKSIHRKITIHKEDIIALMSMDYCGKQCLLSAGKEHVIHFWDVKDMEEPFYSIVTESETFCLTKILNGERESLYSGSGRLSDFSIKIWDLRTRTLEKSVVAHTEAVRYLLSVCINKEDVIVSGSWDHSIKLWKTDLTPLFTISEHIDKIISLTTYFNNESVYLVSSGKDCHIMITDITNRQIIKQIKAHEKTIFSLATIKIRDYYFLASGSEDYTIKIWKL